MDEEQIKSSISSRSDGHDGVEKVLEELIRKDDKRGFVSFIRKYSENDRFKSVQKNFPDCDDIMTWICSHSALHCAIALLKGETGVAVDLNVPLRNGSHPLHLVAQNLHSGLTCLFLRHGARTDLPCADKDSEYFGMLPLNIALEALRRHEYLSDWNPSISIFKLIYCLCFPELIVIFDNQLKWVGYGFHCLTFLSLCVQQEPLNTVKLLSEKTQDLEKISFSIVREGKVVELAGLLFVAWNKLLVPVSGDNVDNSAIGQCVLKNLALLIDEEYKLVNTGRNTALSECRKMQELMASASLMLRVFERSGEIFDMFRPLCFYRHGHPPNFVLVRSTIVMLKRLGFALKREDTTLSDMLCFRIRMKSRHEEELRCSIDQILHSRLSQISSTPFDESRKQKELVPNNLAGHRVVRSPTLRAFHTCRNTRSVSAPRRCTLAEVHYGMTNISSKRPNVLSARWGAYYALTLMKFMAK